MGAMKKTAAEKCESYVLARVTKKQHRAYNAKARAERKALAEIIRRLLEEWLKGKEKAA